MNVLASKIIRFVMNFVFFVVVLVSTIYYAYMFPSDPPEIFALKNTLVPMKGMLFLAILLSLVLAGINEVITIFIIRLSRRK